MTKRKTTPHLKRGPKPQPKPPKRSRGRPTMPLRQHPDRYMLARFDVAHQWLPKVLTGTRTMAKAVRTIDVLQPITDPRKMDDLYKAGDSLRTMARRYRRPADMRWRIGVGNAIGHALMAAAVCVDGKVEQGRIDLIMDYAAAVGETEWVRREVLPLCTLKPLSVPPDLSQGDLLTLLAGAVASIGFASDIKRLIAEQQAAKAAGAQGDDAQTAQPEMPGVFCPT